MSSLENAKDWEKLEIWMVVVWQGLDYYTPESVTDDVERVTREVLFQRASALSSFTNLGCNENGNLTLSQELLEICSRAQTKQWPLESPPLQYVSVRPDQYIHSDATLCLLQSIGSRPATCPPSSC